MLWLLSLALGGEPVVPRPVSPYPTELPQRLTEPRWDRADRYGHRMGVVGGAVSVGGSLGAALGTGMVSLGQDAQGVGLVGGLVQLQALPALVGGPPLLLSGSMRSARALRKRGVRSPTLAGSMGWALYGTTPIFLAMFNRDLDGRGPTDLGALPLLSFGGAIALGYLQLEVNRRHRRRAQLPSVGR